MKKIILISAFIIAGVSLYYGVGTYKGEMEKVVTENNSGETLEGEMFNENLLVENEGEIVTRAIDHNSSRSNRSSTSVELDDGKIQMIELKKHNTKEDCWIVYKGSVYDITKFLPIHPGGVEKILQFCGTTGFEKTFEKKHGEKDSALKFEKNIEKKNLAEQGELK